LTGSVLVAALQVHSHHETVSVNLY
jgi:hypothetical protein